MRAELERILDRDGWIAPRIASALGWSAHPFLVHVLSLPLLADAPPENAEAWRRAASDFSYADFEALFRRHGAPRPKQVPDLLRMAGAAVWADAAFLTASPAIATACAQEVWVFGCAFGKGITCPDDPQPDRYCNFGCDNKPPIEEEGEEG